MTKQPRPPRPHPVVVRQSPATARGLPSLAAMRRQAAGEGEALKQLATPDGKSEI